MSIDDAINDTDRVDYFRGMTRSIVQAVREDGVDVRAYFPWSELKLSDCLQVD
jgi:beta-glucosidase